MRAILFIAVALTCTSSLRADDFFAREVRPILAGHCFKCHGPDDQARKAKLRLDRREDALRAGRSGHKAIVPGKPEASELVARISGDDHDTLMPPPSAKLPLSAAQKKTLERWIREGAQYTTHWAFVAPKRPAFPVLKNRTWARNPIDTFVLSRLEKEGLAPSPEADRYTLARRVALDLVGLPPTPEEADAFVNDARPDAYDRFVDRLLSSPAYGERWARRWLDLARYADTNGYEKDRARSIWPYRDWVIGALNADLPFDRFTVEQLAGDLLPAASSSQRIATGFHRNTMLNEEGGIDPLEFRFHAMTDRVATTGSTWLGLTIGCAQCHTHKYDPISHKEYYQLFAFQNNADEPEMAIPDTALLQRRREIDREVERLEADLPSKFPAPKGKADEGTRRRVAIETKFAQWAKEEAARTTRWTPLEATSAKANLAKLTALPDRSLIAGGDQSKSDTYDLDYRLDGKGITALRLEVLPDERLPKNGPGRIYYEGPFGDFFLSDFSATADGVKVPFASATHSFADGGNTAAKAIDGDPQTGWAINGGQGKAHNAVFVFAKPVTAKSLHVRMLFERYYAAGLGRFRLSVTSDAKPTAHNFPADLEPALLSFESRTEVRKNALFAHFLRTTPELAQARQEIDKLRSQKPALPTTLVLSERPADNPRRTHLHHRGEFLSPLDRVEAGVPNVLPPFPKDQPRDRLGFARWLVAPDNPLVSRVTVNRQWDAFFGRGIVPSLADFGLQGDLPSHPELLDWLALEFVETGWSMKRLHRLIVTSATYRQSSRTGRDLQRRDPSNRLLARGPRIRLEAEVLRDAVLRSSGLLSMKLGGPSVFPPQPAEVTTDGTYGGLAWNVSPGLDRHRRGLYTFSKRTAPFTLFGTFDGPSGEVCIARREVSNTPLQALTLLNDLTIIEASQHLGRTVAEEKGAVKERVSRLFRRVLVRPATQAEQDLLVRFFDAQKGRLDRKELDAASITGVAGDTPESRERAAWVLLARVLFNLDEMITRS